MGFSPQSLLEHLLQTTHPLEKHKSITILTYATALAGAFQTRVLERSKGLSQQCSPQDKTTFSSRLAPSERFHSAVSASMSMVPERWHEEEYTASATRFVLSDLWLSDLGSFLTQ